MFLCQHTLIYDILTHTHTHPCTACHSMHNDALHPSDANHLRSNFRMHPFSYRCQSVNTLLRQHNRVYATNITSINGTNHIFRSFTMAIRYTQMCIHNVLVCVCVWVLMVFAIAWNETIDPLCPFIFTDSFVLLSCFHLSIVAFAQFVITWAATDTPPPQRRVQSSRMGVFVARCLVLLSFFVWIWARLK